MRRAIQLSAKLDALFELEFTPDQKAYRAKRAAKLERQTSKRQKKIGKLMSKGLTKSEATKEIAQKKEGRAAYWGGSYGAIKSRQKSNAINANLGALTGRTLFELGAKTASRHAWLRARQAAKKRVRKNEMVRDVRRLKKPQRPFIDPNSAAAGIIN
jgi:hypothetical protein